MFCLEVGKSSTPFGHSEKAAPITEKFISQFDSLVEDFCEIPRKSSILLSCKLLIINNLTRWRREGDSNPRYSF